MSEERIDPRSVLIDGATGEVIGSIPRKARTAKPTFVGETEKKQPVVKTKVVRRYRGMIGPPITNRKAPPGPTAEQMARHLGAAIGKGIRRGQPPIVTLADFLIGQFIKKMEGK